jgi:hypothetical protein
MRVANREIDRQERDLLNEISTLHFSLLNNSVFPLFPLFVLLSK